MLLFLKIFHTNPYKIGTPVHQGRKTLFGPGDGKGGSVEGPYEPTYGIEVDQVLGK